jgi:hypothetical protein
MKRLIWCVVMVGIAFALGVGTAIHAATKAYQFTGVVKSNEGGTLTVEKTPKEIWTFTTNGDTKGTAKAGDRVTVYYTMVATEIEAKAATPAKKK